MQARALTSLLGYAGPWLEVTGLPGVRTVLACSTASVQHSCRKYSDQASPSRLSAVTSASLGQRSTGWAPYASLAAALCGSALVAALNSTAEAEAPQATKSFPVIPRSEVEKHTTAETGIWVTHGEGVYDVTDFVEAHPGGSRILLAAGGPVEPYWAMYAQHKQPQVYAILGEMRIGTLPEDERVVAVEDPYANDPARDARIKVLSQTPFNGEAPPHMLLDSFVTPNELHFKRSHMPIPDIVPKAYELQVVGPDGEALTLSLEALKRDFPKHSVTVTLQCAGNRRAEMSRVRGTQGLDWTGGAISTAVWSGARLADVLKAQGVQAGPDAKHVEFVGLDCDTEGQRYAASIPIEKALAEGGDCLLAYEMNGEDIPREHGYPVRAIVPGHVAARSIKWVDKVVVSEDESQVHWQQKDYKGFCPDEDWEHLDWSKAPSIQETPVTSAIVAPQAGTALKASAKSVKVRGYAYAGGGRDIIRVDVSADGGRSWTAAELKPVPKEQEQGHRQHWAWRHWEVDVPVSDKLRPGDNVTLVCKAVDDSYNVQPDTWGPIYNKRGVLANAWHQIQLPVTS